MIHPFDNPAVMAGQGTAALELMEDAPELDVVLAPIGGGGLISGVSTAVKALRPAARVIGAEPAGADDAARSFARRAADPADRRRHHRRRPARLAQPVDLRPHPPRRRRSRHRLRTRHRRGHARALGGAEGGVEPSAAVAYAAVREGKVDVRGQPRRHHPHRRQRRPRPAALGSNLAAGGQPARGPAAPPASGTARSPPPPPPRPARASPGGGTCAPAWPAGRRGRAAAGRRRRCARACRPSFSRTVTTQPRPIWVGSMLTLLAQRDQVGPPRGGVAEERFLEGVLARERQRGGHAQRELALQPGRRRLDVADAEVAGRDLHASPPRSPRARRASSVRSWFAASIELWVR